MKPFIFEYIGWLGKQSMVRLKFFFLTRRSSHAEVRALARFADELVCVVDDGQGEQPRGRSQSPAEYAWYDAPRELIFRLGADLLYCPFGICSWSHPGIPTLATVVDVLHRDYPFTLAAPDIAYRESAFHELIKRADRIQGISQYTLSRIFHHYGYPKERMFCSPIAIHSRLRTNTWTPVQSPNARPPYFLYPANAWAHKNHQVLFLAYGIYLSRAGANAWDLVLTGHDNPAMQRLREMATTLGLDPHAHFLGYLDDDQFSQVWSQAGALVFPSLHEGFGIPLLEAMEFGLPILSSQTCALPEVGGDACLYVDCTKPLELADAMLRLAQDPALRAECCRRGELRLASFSFDRDAAHFLEELVACASGAAKFAREGFYADGWTGPQAFVALPNWERISELEITLAAMPASRALKVYHGNNLLSHTRIPAGEARSIRCPIWSDGTAISLAVPDASRIADNDHRTHGILVKALRLRDRHGADLDLLTT